MDIRVDRLITLSLARFRQRSENESGRLPVLMYHGISEEEDVGRHAYYRTVTSPRVFEEQMAYLSRSGYSALGVHEIGDRVNGCRGTSALVALTFDDGYQDFYINAFPVLKKYGLTATVFLPSRFIGHERQTFKGRPCMTWKEVRELERSGIWFGSHTVTHPQLRDLDMEAITGEVSISKQTIEQEVGVGLQAFAYPYAFPEADADFKERLRDTLRVAGYTCGVCTSVGRVDEKADQYFMRRLPVNSCDDIGLFDAKLNGAYDWVKHPQKWMKFAKSWRRNA
jgi:peptidoglycan/xylan/chitin deacetylase (PgdA/CDA1 family)